MAQPHCFSAIRFPDGSRSAINSGKLSHILGISFFAILADITYAGRGNGTIIMA